jgi:hypothetical protein
VRIFVNGNPAGQGSSSAGGTFSVPVPTLLAGQRVTATVQAATELESLQSTAVVVAGVGGESPCSDGKDNDGDGKIDFPNDPGCTSASDVDETDVPQCSDGVDNDGDGKIDFPDDPGCSSYVDAVESAPPACMDGIDDDGDGKTDFPADPGCASATDVSEADIPRCADGIDNDGDGAIDFPADPGCTSSLDDDEASSAASGDLGLADDLGLPVDPDGGSSGGYARPDGAPPNPGGVPYQSGCGCEVGAADRAAAPGGPLVVAMGLLALFGLARRRRRYLGEG